MATNKPTQRELFPQAAPPADARKDRRDRRDYHARQKADRLAAGLCLLCGKSPHAAGKQMCPDCLERRKHVYEASRERRRLRQGKPPKGTPKPPPVSADMAAYKRAWRTRMRAAGICTDCGSRDAQPGRTRCQECRGKDKADYVRIGRARYQNRADLVNARDRARRAIYRAEGRCSWCGAERDHPFNHYCCRCLTRTQVYCQRRRVAITRNGGDFTLAEWEAVRAAQDYTCLACGRREPEINLSIDHVIPVTLGGDNFITNIQGLCMDCNHAKSITSTDYRLFAAYPHLFPWNANG